MRLGYVWDDERYLLRNDWVTQAKGLISIWTTWHQHINYWPLSISTFWLQWQIWGDTAWAYHAVNVSLHMVNVALLYHLFARLYDAEKSLLIKFAVLIFAIHPLQVESVVYVSELKNLLFFFWMLLALIFASRFLATAGIAILGVYLCFLLALLSKTHACVLPGLFFILPWASQKRLTRKWWRHTFLMSLMSLGAIALFMAQEFHNQAQAKFQLDISILERFSIVSRSFWTYWLKFFWPDPLLPIYPFWDLHFSAPMNLLALCACGGYFFFAFWAYKRGLLRLCAGLLWYVTAILPVLGLVNHQMLESSYVADHFVYAALPGMLLALSECWRSFARKCQELGLSCVHRPLLGKFCKILAIGLGVILVISLSGKTISHTENFTNDFTLWNYTTTNNPGAYKAWHNLGYEFLLKGKYIYALDAFSQAIKLNPGLGQAWLNRAVSNQALGQWESALTDYQKAIVLMPSDTRAPLNRVALLRKLGMTQEAVKELTMLVELHPQEDPVYLRLAECFLELKQIQPALDILQRGLAVLPNAAALWRMQGQVHREQKDFSAAQEFLQKALSLHPQDEENWFQWALLLEDQGRWGEAEDAYSHVITLALNPQAALYNRSLLRAGVLQKRGQACQDWQQLCELGQCTMITQARQRQDCL